jgi:tetratricopeptide (TPR) repeat protein
VASEALQLRARSTVRIRYHCQKWVALDLSQMAAAASKDSSDEFWHDCPLFAPDASLVPNLAEGDTAENLPEAVGALAHLLYDEDTPDEIAEDLREQGNTLFKHGHRNSYIRAVAKYTEALQVPCNSVGIRSAAFANRAAAQLKLKNYGKALDDAESALALNGDHVKSRYRAALCANYLQKFDKALMHSDAGLSLLQFNGMGRSLDATLFTQLRETAKSGRDKAVAEEEAAQKRKLRMEAASFTMSQALTKRRVTMGLPLFSQQRKYSRKYPVFGDHGGDGNAGEAVVVWPVLVVYPDVRGIGCDQSDYLEQVSEEATIADVIASLFPEHTPPPPWDLSGAYSRRADNLIAQYRPDWTMRAIDADSDDERDFVGSNLGPDDVGPWKSVSHSTSIAQLVSKSDYIVPLFPVIYVVPA